MRKGHLTGALLVGLLWALQLTAGAQPAAVQVDLNADQRSLVLQLTAERAVTLAREHRLADEAQERFYQQLAAKDQALRAAQARAAGQAAELAQVRKARDEIARQLIAAVEQRDRTLAAELSAYREEVTQLASSPDPQTQKALQRFADGEQAEALDDLDMIADAKRAAHDKAVVIADAAERRPMAWLAVQALDAGKVKLDKVVERFEKLTRLDPGVSVDWIELGRLYSQQGRLADVQKANESALRSLAASDERTRSIVLNELGDAAVAAGDLPGARARYEESLAIQRKLARDNPTSAQAQRDLSISLDELEATSRWQPATCPAPRRATRRAWPSGASWPRTTRPPPRPSATWPSRWTGSELSRKTAPSCARPCRSPRASNKPAAWRPANTE